MGIAEEYNKQLKFGWIIINSILVAFNLIVFVKWHGLKSIKKLKVYNNVKCHNKGDTDIYNIQDNEICPNRTLIMWRSQSNF